MDISSTVCTDESMSRGKEFGVCKLKQSSSSEGGQGTAVRLVLRSVNAACSAQYNITRHDIKVRERAGRKYGIRVNTISAGPLGSRAAKAIGSIDDMIRSSTSTVLITPSSHLDP